MDIKFVKPERIWLNDHPLLDETWVKKQIADDRSILGLGELILKDKERGQPHAGRLDILLQDSDTDRRYEVEASSSSGWSLGADVSDICRLRAVASSQGGDGMVAARRRRA